MTNKLSFILLVAITLITFVAAQNSIGPLNNGKLINRKGRSLAT